MNPILSGNKKKDKSCYQCEYDSERAWQVLDPMKMITPACYVKPGNLFSEHGVKFWKSPTLKAVEAESLNTFNTETGIYSNCSGIKGYVNVQESGVGQQSNQLQS